MAEFKKISGFAYKRVEREGVTDEWGYLSQVDAYTKALGLDKTIFVVLDGQSGALNERVVEFDLAIWEAMAERGSAILKSTPEDLPARAFEPESAQNGKMAPELRCRYCQYKHHC